MMSNKELAIYYFSATGNSFKLAKDIASHFANPEIVSMSAKSIQLADARMVGFIFPVYMGGLPKIVHKFLQNFAFRENVYYFSIGTYYTYRGSAMSVVSKIMKDKGVSLNYANYLPSVGNCLKEYEVSTDKRDKILKRADDLTRSLIDDLINGVETRPRKYCKVLDKFHRSLFNAFFSKTYQEFTLEDNCIGCGMCEKVCPVNNIQVKDGKPQWGTNCESCHACLHWCPRNAINLGKSKGRLRYHHPGVKSGMLVNS